MTRNDLHTMTGLPFGNLDKQLKVEGRQNVTIFPDMFIIQRNILPFSRRQVIMTVINCSCERIRNGFDVKASTLRCVWG